MKTTDLIPLILHQLIEGDKYGYDIVKKIEDDSNGAINIKQPTLYSLLKKLEQNQFITSYWEDSEIGGKRHYYKITANGKAQADTYPTYESLIASCCGVASPTPQVVAENASPSIVELTYNEFNNSASASDDTPSSFQQANSYNSYDNSNSGLGTYTEASPTFDTVEQPTIQPIDLLKGTTENSKIEFSQPSYAEYQGSVFNSLEEASHSTETCNIQANADNEFGDSLLSFDSEQNTQNKQHSNATANIFDAIGHANSEYNEKEQLNYVTPENTNQDEEREEMSNLDKPNISPTPLKNSDINPKLADQLTPLNIEPEQEKEQAVATIDHNVVPYINYVNLKTDKASLERKKMLKMSSLKTILTCLTLFVILGITLVIAIKTSFSTIYCVYLILAGLVLIFYPLLFFKEKTKRKLKYCTSPLEYNLFMDFFVKLSLFLISVILIFAYNIKTCYQFADIFTFSNISSILSPILLSFVLLIDFGYSCLCFKDFKVKK